MKIIFNRTLTVIVSLGILAMVTPAQAQLSISLVPSQLGPVSPGGSISFSGTVTNTDATNEFFLNGDQVLLSGFNVGGFTIDDSAFLLGSPLSLSPSASYTGALFTLYAPSGLLSSSYAGSFTVLGGLSSFDNGPIGSQSLSFRAVPEPGIASFLVVSFITGAGFAFRGRMKRR